MSVCKAFMSIDPYMNQRIRISMAPPVIKTSHRSIPNGVLMGSTEIYIVRTMKAGCHWVAIAHVVEH